MTPEDRDAFRVSFEALQAERDALAEKYGLQLISFFDVAATRDALRARVSHLKAVLETIGHCMASCADKTTREEVQALVEETLKAVEP